MRLKWMQSRISSSVQRAARRVQDCSHRRLRGQCGLEHFLHGPEIYAGSDFSLDNIALRHRRPADNSNLPKVV